MNYSTSHPGHGPRREGSREQFWRDTVRQFAASGQSVRAFCSSRRLAEHSFYAWRRRLATCEAAAPKAASAPSFLPVRLTEAMGGVMEIVLVGGRCIRLHGPVDGSALMAVVAALEGQPSTADSAR